MSLSKWAASTTKNDTNSPIISARQGLKEFYMHKNTYILINGLRINYIFTLYMENNN